FAISLGHFDLMMLSPGLRGSRFVARSLMTISPGRSIRANVRFRVKNDSTRTFAGESQLSASWRFGRQISNYFPGECKMSSDSTTYSYEQENPPITIQVKR